MRKFRIAEDKVTRKIVVKMDGEGADLQEDEARAVADKRITDEGTTQDWYFEETHRMAYDWVDVYYVA